MLIINCKKIERYSIYIPLSIPKVTFKAKKSK